MCMEGILLTRTRLSVSKLVDYVRDQPGLQGRVIAEKLVGQGTMTNIQQENTLRRFHAGQLVLCGAWWLLIVDTMLVSIVYPTLGPDFSTWMGDCL